MADKPFINPAQAAINSVGVPPKKKKRRPKPTVAKPNSGARPSGISRPAPALRDAYGLVFDDVAAQSFEGQTEQEALGELYKRRTGKELSAQANVRQALEDAQIIRKAGAPKRASDLKAQQSLFASALDWIDSQIDELNDPTGKRLSPLRPREADGPQPGKETRSTISDAVGDAIGSGLRTVGESASELLRTKLDVPGVAEDPSIGQVMGAPLYGAMKGVEKAVETKPAGVIGAAFEAINPKAPTVRGAGGKLKQQLPSAKQIGDLPAGPQLRVGGDFTEAQREGSDVWFESPVLSARMESGKTLRDEMRGGGIDPTRLPDKQAQSFFNSVIDTMRGASNEAVLELATMMQMARDSASSSEMAQVQRGPLSGAQRKMFLDQARKIGWDIANPQDYSDAELIRRAFSLENPVGEARRNLIRQTAQFSSLPAGFVAIGEELASGDPNRIKNLVVEALQPYAYVIDDAERRGWPAALGSFAQERPVDAALLFSAIVRSTGRTMGVAARTAGGTGRALPQLLLQSQWRPKPGSKLDRLGKFAEVDRPVALKTGEVRVGNQTDAEVKNSEYIIGYTTPNLFSTLALGARKVIGQQVINRPGKVGWVAQKTLAGRSRRTIRRIKNRSDDAAARAALALQEVSVGLNRKQLLRLALELTSAMVKPTQLGGGRYSFAERAAHWRGRAEQARANAGLVRAGEMVTPDGKKLTQSAQEYVKDALLFDRQARFFDDVASTPLDEARIQAAREAVREVGDDNDTIVALVLEELGVLDDPRSFERAAVRPSELVVGSRIDVGGPNETVPVRVRSVEALPDGGVRIEQQNILDPADVRVREIPASERVVVLRPGVNQVKYLRQWLEWEESLKAIAEDVASARNALSRADLAPLNAALGRLRVLNARREVAYKKLQAVLDKMEAARRDGKLARTRALRKQYETKVAALLRQLREMEQLALRAAEEARKLDRNDPLVGRLEAEAARLRADREAIVRSRGVEGRAPFRVDGGLVDELPGDAVSARQARVLRTMGEGEAPPLRSVDQPEAVARLERAQGLEERASRLEQLRADLEARRAEAPSATQAGAARRELRQVGEDVQGLVRQSNEARVATTDFANALDDLVERLLYLESKRPWPKQVGERGRARKARLAFLRATMDDRAEARRVLQQLDDRVQSDGRIAQADVDALERAEALVVGVEKRTTRYKSASFGMRSAGASPNFGKRRVREVVVAPREKANRVLADARSREARADELTRRIGARDAAPSAAELRQVDRMVKGLRRESLKMQREAERIIARGRPLVSGRNIKTVMNAAGNTFAVELLEKRKPVRFTVNQVMGEMKQEFMARAEMTGDDPVLWLGTRRSMFGLSSRSWRRDPKLDMGPSGGIGGPRLMTNTGQVTRSGLESMRRAWENLIADTGEIRGAREWQRQVRLFIESVSLRIDDVTVAEARKLNETLLELLPEEQRAAFVARVNQALPDVELSEAESVVHDARQFVALQTYDGKPMGRDRVDLGAIDEVDDAALVDLFKRSAAPAEIAQAGGSYLLIPRFLYDQIMDEIDAISYRPGGTLKKADSLTKQWRNFTLNIFPRTGVANLTGSMALAVLAGAGPKSFYLAYRHLRYGDVPAPVELRQRFGMTLTTNADFAWVRDNQPWLDSPLGALAWWMNTMRRFNGISEDFGRLAVWYSKAYPEARRLADEEFAASWRQMRMVTERQERLLQAFANNDPDYEAIAQRAVDASFEFIGDLHSGGKVNTALRVAIPFQQWYRHILRLMFVTMPVKYPGRSLVVQKIAEIGNEYLKEHGVLAPWEADMLPIYEEEKTLLGEKQKYILGWRTGPWNPLQTGAQLASGDVLDWGDYGLGALAPIWKNAFLAGYSFLSGEMQQTGGDALTRTAMDEFNNPIKLFSWAGAQTLLNMGVQTAPLSSTAMSSMGQTAEGNALWNPTQRLLRGDEGLLPIDALPPVAPGKDFVQAGGTVKDLLTGALPLSEADSYANLMALGWRIFFGGSFSYAIGSGPVQRSQYEAMLGNLDSGQSRYINNIINNLMEKARYADAAGRPQEAERYVQEAERRYKQMTGE